MLLQLGYEGWEGERVLSAPHKQALNPVGWCNGWALIGSNVAVVAKPIFPVEGIQQLNIKTKRQKAYARKMAVTYLAVSRDSQVHEEVEKCNVSQKRQ